MKLLAEANKYGRETARGINNVIRRDGNKVKAIVKTFVGAGLNVQHINVDSGSYNINITGSRADLDIMFGLLRRAGLSPTRRPEEKSATYYAAWHAEDYSLSVWVFFSSTSCKRVQVGTKTEEVPVYETVCEE
jgi:hypothetical protein